MVAMFLRLLRTVELGVQSPVYTMATNDEVTFRLVAAQTPIWDPNHRRRQHVNM